MYVVIIQLIQSVICKNLDPVEDTVTQQTSPSLPPSPEPDKTDDPEAEPEPDPETQEANSEAEPITQQPQKTEKDSQRTNTQKDPEKVCGPNTRNQQVLVRNMHVYQNIHKPLR